MKQIKYLNSYLITGFLLIACSQLSIAQSNTTGKNDSKKQTFKNMVDSQNFVFVAQSATPLRGRFRNLTSQNDVTISKDSLVSYLPYFGRAYSAPIDPQQAPLDFTSTSFSYSVTPHKKNGWDVVIKPKDNSAVQLFQFTIYDNGSASLSVTNTSRDPISFNGYIQERGSK
jgi:Domain of unknown function (DUF4251)